MKRLIALSLTLIMAFPAAADEGMWLPILLDRTYSDMKENGLRLSQEEIYSVNQSSLKDAIVSFGGFCTGEIISDQGLMLTNHHCGYSAIQEHSTPENNYLKNGFWAMDKSQEKMNEDLYARFLVRIADVTDSVMAGINEDMSEKERDQAISKISRKLTAQATEDTHYDAEVKSFYHGNEFYLFVYETFNDVRLVGAPPKSIGKFGGDTDNWMWPRHTGDFSMFRVYSGPDGKPAEYSEDNVPLNPKHHLPVSIAGVKKGDFTMVFGYPGSTDRYLTSYGVRQAIDKYNPTVVDIRDEKLDIMKSYMQKNPELDLAYASKYAQVSNYWKYYIGQTEQLKNNNVFEAKQEIEEEFRQWVNSSEANKEKYGNTLKLLEEGYNESDEYIRNKVYVREAGLLGADINLFGFRVGRLLDAYFSVEEKMKEALEEAESAEDSTEVKSKYQPRMEAMIGRVKSQAKEHFDGYSTKIDRDLLATVSEMYANNIPEAQQPEYLDTVQTAFNGDFGAWADTIFTKSFLAHKDSLMAFLEDPSKEELENDHAIAYSEDLYEVYSSFSKKYADTENKLEKGYRQFTAGLREMNPEKNYYPDANSTMRLTWGTVDGYQARDAVYYEYFTTHDGIMQKKDNEDPEFKVPDVLSQHIKNKNFGRYADENGDLPVCFIHNTDITGGNSGSPVINGHGELIGCAFDGNWEAMSGDIFFEDRLQRTISVDARYILFTIDKLYGAGHLVDEMTLVTERHKKKGGFLWFN